jgi:hypothetical protein
LELRHLGVCEVRLLSYSTTDAARAASEHQALLVARRRPNRLCGRARAKK